MLNDKINRKLTLKSRIILTAIIPLVLCGIMVLIVGKYFEGKRIEMAQKQQNEYFSGILQTVIARHHDNLKKMLNSNLSSETTTNFLDSKSHTDLEEMIDGILRPHADWLKAWVFYDKDSKPFIIDPLAIKDPAKFAPYAVHTKNICFTRSLKEEISSYCIDFSSKTPLLWAIEPIYNEDGEPSGVSELATPFEKIIDDIKALLKIEIGMLDNDNNCLCTTDNPLFASLFSDFDYSSNIATKKNFNDKIYKIYTLQVSDPFSKKHIGKLFFAEDITSEEILNSKKNMVLIISFTIILVLITIFTLFSANGINKDLRKVIEVIKEFTNQILKGDLTHASFGNLNQVNPEFRGTIDQVDCLVKSLIGPIKESMDIIRVFSKKDLTARIQGNYQGELEDFKENINKLGNNLQEALQQVNSSAGQTFEEGERLTKLSNDFFNRIEVQSEAMNNITDTMSNIGKQTQRNATAVTKVFTFSQSAKKNAENGKVQIDKMVSAMNEIKDASDSIQKITKVIDEIAFQTNLLALNAAVEAARAGSHGKGFAVVASEVRNLAARSAKAANETSELVKNTAAKIQQGTNLATGTATVFVEIVDNSSKVSALVDEITSDSQDQATQIIKATTAIEEINQQTGENTKYAKNASATAYKLLDQAKGLKEMVSKFTLTKK